MSVSFSNCEQETNFSWCCRMSRKCSWLKGKTSSVRGACGTMLTSWELIWVMSLTVGYPAVFMPVQHTICIGQFVMGFQSSDWLRADNQTIYKLQSCNHASVISWLSDGYQNYWQTTWLKVKKNSHGFETVVLMSKKNYTYICFSHLHSTVGSSLSPARET